MSKRLVVVIAAALVVSAAPWANAEEWHEVTFEAPVPGTVLVPYWLADNLCIGCNPDGQVRIVLRETPWGDRPLTNARLIMEICDKPFPPGVYDEESLGQPPGDVVGLAAEIYPEVDWDFAICALRGPTAWELRRDPDDTEVRWRESTFGVCICVFDCRGPLSPWVPTGCVDKKSTSVAQGLPYKLLAYNWSDPFPAPGRWSWI